MAVFASVKFVVGCYSTDATPSSSSSSGASKASHDARRKKKNFYAALKRQEDTKFAELSDKYRDRARERRDGANPDYQHQDPSASSANAYRAVAPDLKSGIDAAERRKQMIQVNINNGASP